MMAKNLSEWRKFVIARDGMCLKCGEITGLEAHHIKQHSLCPELLLDTDNGGALCHSCHKLIDVIKHAPVKHTWQFSGGHAMRMVRLMRIGNSIGVMIPAFWIQSYNGNSKFVTLDLNDNGTIVIEPEKVVAK